MTDNLMKYDQMVEDALRGVVRKALEHAGDEGLPGDHHFYLTFRTTAPGVSIPDYLHDQYPEEMTIVFQHQYWGLEVDENGFYITLSFSDSQERIYVPFHALLSFMDPYAKFGLQFAPPPFMEMTELDETGASVEAIDNKDNVVTLDSFRKK